MCFLCFCQILKVAPILFRCCSWIFCIMNNHTTGGVHIFLSVWFYLQTTGYSTYKRRRLQTHSRLHTIYGWKSRMRCQRFPAPIKQAFMLLTSGRDCPGRCDLLQKQQLSLNYPGYLTLASSAGMFCVLTRLNCHKHTARATTAARTSATVWAAAIPVNPSHALIT